MGVFPAERSKLCSGFASDHVVATMLLPFSSQLRRIAAIVDMHLNHPASRLLIHWPTIHVQFTPADDDPMIVPITMQPEHPIADARPWSLLWRMQSATLLLWRLAGKAAHFSHSEHPSAATWWGFRLSRITWRNWFCLALWLLHIKSPLRGRFSVAFMQLPVSKACARDGTGY
jgi:hypothetical protein